MKLTIILLLVVLLPLCFSVPERNFLQKAHQHLSSTVSGGDQRRQTFNGCTKFSCQNAGGPCLSLNPCSNCLTLYNNCTASVPPVNTNHTNSANVSAALCACWQNRLACLAQSSQCYFTAAVDVEICLQGGVVPTNCSCGSAGTPPMTENVCYSGEPITCSSNNLCVAQRTSGACTSDNDCGDPNSGLLTFSTYFYTCQNISGSLQCAKVPNTQAAGDSCTTSTDCVDNLPCTNGICKGQTVGGFCSSSASCSYGFFCDANQCTPDIAPGAICPTADACPFGYVCGYSPSGNPICARQNAVPGGGYCFQDAECQFGFYCSPVTGVCTAPPSNFVPCNVDTDCAGLPGAFCGCNADGTKTCSITPYAGNVAACQTQFNNALNCLNQYQCFSAFGSGTCGSNHCKNQLNCYYSCLYGKISTGPNECLKIPTFPCSVSSTISVSAILLFVALSVVVLF